MGGSQMNKSKFQSIIRNHCCTAAHALYQKDLKIFFEEELGYVGVYRNESCPPPIANGLKNWLKGKYASITFDDVLFSPGCWEEDRNLLWDYMIHEVTHIEVGTVCSVKWRISHPPKFYNAMRRNKKKVVSLKKDFFKELLEESK